MTTTTPEDADALFDAPPAPAPAPAQPPATPTTATATAEAAPTGATTASAAPAASSPVLPSPFGNLSVGSADNRREQRVKVSWPGRVQLPNGRVIDLKVRDISEGGVGLLTDVHIPAYTVLNFAMGVPPLAEGGQVTPVSGTIKTTYLVVQGPDIYCGGTWVQLPPAGLELVDKWVRKMRR